jgi:hypothetical protein
MSLPAQAEISAATIVRSSAATDRLAFVDNVRWVMILLVLYMHAAVTYSPFGGWYYRERTQAGLATLFFFGTSQAFLQGFFMALLFFVSGYFVPSSFRAFYTSQGSFARFMSRNAFAVYVVHPPILVALAVALSGYAAPPVAKCLLLWLLGALLCFGVAAPLARRLPLIGRIL